MGVLGEHEPGTQLEAVVFEAQGEAAAKRIVVSDSERGMSPQAADSASVFEGHLSYVFDGKKYKQEVIAVEVGQLTSEGAERTPEEFLNSRRASDLLGLNIYRRWITVGDNGERKLLIFKAWNEAEGKYDSFTTEEAQRIVEAINEVLQLARVSRDKIKAPFAN